jgi:hypothetical protein
MSKNNTLLRKVAFASADLFGGGSFNIINFCPGNAPNINDTFS